MRAFADMPALCLRRRRAGRRIGGIIAGMDRYERIIALHRVLQAARRPVTVARLQDELACSRATVYRDLAFLRDGLMAPLVGDGEAGFSYDKSDDGRFELPGLWLNSEELHALLAAQQLLSRSSGGMLSSARSCWTRIPAARPGRWSGCG